jgi:hypothetical protein
MTTSRPLSVLITLLCCLVPTALAHATPPLRVNYQGKLLDPSGAPLTGSIDVDVSVWSDATSTAPEQRRYAEHHAAVPVLDGVFELALGGGSAQVGSLEAALLGPGERWLELAIDSGTLAPRAPLRSVPYALEARTLAAPTTVDNTPVPVAQGFAPNHRTPGLTLNAGQGGQSTTYALAINDADADRIAWLFRDLGASSRGSLVIDGSYDAHIDPVTHVVTTYEWGFIVDPDGPGSLATMMQLGADVETALILRGSLVSVNGRQPKLILGLDREKDWVFQVETDGDLWWGDPAAKGEDSFDLRLARVEDAGFAHPRFVLAANDPQQAVNVDIKAPLVQGTGATTHGPAYWAVSDGGAFDTSSEVCARESLSCQGALDLSNVADPAHGGCGDAHAGGAVFLAFCR